MPRGDGAQDLLEQGATHRDQSNLNDQGGARALSIAIVVDAGLHLADLVTNAEAGLTAA